MLPHQHTVLCVCGCLSKLPACWQDGCLIVKFRMVCRVNMNTNPIQGRLEGFLGARVKHFASDIGRIRIPGNKDKLAGRPIIDRRKGQINDSVTTIILRHFFAKVFVGHIACTLLVNDNRLFVFNLVDNVAKFFTLLQFKVIKGGTHLVGYNNSCGLSY
jgi:hypothetical protein